MRHQLIGSLFGRSPQRFFSDPKEPNFFSTDIEIPWKIRSVAEYMWLFRRVKPQHLAIGEGSVAYIQSRVAVPSILDFSPNAKFLVMLRSPIEICQAIRTDNLVGLDEDEPNFERAWRLQKDRKAAT